MMPPERAARAAGGLRRDRRGATALETGLLMMPFVLLLVAIIQTGVYFVTQAALDAGVLAAAETLRTDMAAGASYTPPSAAALKTSIISGGGQVITASQLAVDVRPLSTLAGGAIPVADGITVWGGSSSVLVVRATTTASWIVAGTGTLSLSSMAIVRRPAY